MRFLVFEGLGLEGGGEGILGGNERKAMKGGRRAVTLGFWMKERRN